MRQASPVFLPYAVFDDRASHVWPKVIRLYIVLIAASLLAWVWAFATFHGYPLLLATALIAYGFGLRHAVDADHIAAIDNVTRKLMEEGKRPIGLLFPARPFDDGDWGCAIARPHGGEFQRTRLPRGRDLCGELANLTRDLQGDRLSRDWLRLTDGHPNGWPAATSPAR